MEPDLTKAIEAATIAVDTCMRATGTEVETYGGTWALEFEGTEGGDLSDDAKDIATAAIEAALPELRKAIAEELRTEHRNLRGVPLWVNGFEHGIEEAERVVRGQSGGCE